MAYPEIETGFSSPETRCKAASFGNGDNQPVVHVVRCAMGDDHTGLVRITGSIRAGQRRSGSPI